MGNPNTKLSVDGRFEAGVLNCRHSPRIELRLPDHPECQSCCHFKFCETHDPTHPEMMNFKRIVQNFLEPQAATASSSTAEEVAERDTVDNPVEIQHDEVVDPDFSATRDRSESQSGFSDPAEDSVKTLLDLDSLMEQEEILREAEAGRNCLIPSETQSQGLESVQNEVANSSLLNPDDFIPLVLVETPRGCLRLPSNSSRHELDKSYVQEEIFSSPDLSETHQIDAPALDDTDSDADQSGLRNFTVRPGTIEDVRGRQLKRTTSRIELLQSTSKKPRMTEPAPSPTLD